MKQFNIIALLVFVSALVWIFFLSPESVAAMRSTFMGWFSPVVKVAGAAQGELIEDQRPRGEILTELKNLKEEVFNLRFQQREFAQLESRIQELRDALQFSQDSKFGGTIAAQIIKRTSTSWWSTVTINRGKDHGLTKDLPVITEDYAIVGKVIAGGLTDTTAEVLLLTDEQCRVASRIGRSASLRGLVHGHRGIGNLRPEIHLTLKDKGVTLPAGAVVYTDDIGAGQVYPPGLLVGKVVRPIPGENVDRALVEPLADFTNLKLVFVITSTGIESASVPPTPQPGDRP